jgi:hypothetical protein
MEIECIVLEDCVGVELELWLTRKAIADEAQDEAGMAPFGLGNS